MINAIRRRSTALKISKRLKQLKRYGTDAKEYIQHHRFAKTDLGCRVSKCKCCHKEKYDDKITENCVGYGREYDGEEE